jgi:hypothetical protein
MNQRNDNFKAFIIKTVEKFLSIVSFIFPFIEISYYFGPKVFLSADSLILKSFYLNYIQKLTLFYQANTYPVFIFMVVVFIVCSRGSLPLSRYARFNIIQAILVNIICSCICFIYALLPVFLRESALGLLFANFFYLGVVIFILYASLLIFYGKYPTIPVISEAAKLQVQQY